MREPFPLTSPLAWNTDRRTRVTLFALNLSLRPGEDLSAVTADAEDAAHRRYNLKVEALMPVPGQEWLSAVTLRLNDDLTDTGDVLVQVAYRGTSSNRVRFGIGRTGGGPPDDAGAAPTPAPPYFIGGVVASGGAGLGGVSVTLTGPQTQTLTTDESGSYSFAVTAVDDYTLTVSKPFFAFDPPSRTFNNLSNQHLNLVFLASRQTFSVGGQVRDDNGQALEGIEVALLNEFRGTLANTLTDAGGNFSFPGTSAGYIYEVLVKDNSFFTFNAQNIPTLAADSTLAFSGARRRYAIQGRATDADGRGVSDVALSLSGSQLATTATDGEGNYSFTSLPAGGNYTITASKTYHDLIPPSRTFTNLGGNQTGNFVAVVSRYRISGRVQDDNEQALEGVEVTLSNESGATLRTTLTNAGGSYSFLDLPAGQSYTVTPGNNSFFSFNAQNIPTLAADSTLAFSGVRRLYTIQGKALNASGQAIGGATITLSGSQAATATTGSDGLYTFNGLAAGGVYTLTPSKAQYDFEPQSRTFQNLSAAQVSDFAGVLRRYVINGRVTDVSGNGLGGISITLSGSETSVVKTGSDGQFSFAATAATLDYTLTPHVEQDLYVFTPSSQTLQNLSANQSLVFTAQLAPIPDPSYVLEFDGTPKTVDYGLFWEPYIELGHFYWEFWAMPGANAGATYMLSDGYGGYHALLFGVANFNTSEPGRYQLLGNTFDGYVGRHVTYFGSDQGPAIGEWGHFAVGWDGQSIITYFNGVPVGKMAYSIPRASSSTGDGGGRLLIGGSDHSNFDGRIAQVRGYEGRNPLADATGPTGGAVEAAFAPQTVFSVGGNLLSYFFRPATPKVADLSRGFDGTTHEGNIHTGTPRGTTAGVLYDCGSCPPPSFVIDPTAPNFAQGTAPQPVLVPTPTPPPAGALVFDSFSRANSLYLYNARGGLGSTEAGTMEGALVWQTDQDAAAKQPFGILNGRAVLLGNNTHVAWVSPEGSNANLDISARRHPGHWGSGLDTGLSFRVVDSRNYFFAYTTGSDNSTSPRRLTIGYYEDGVRSDLATAVSLPDSWTMLRVVTTTGGQLKVYADAALVYSTTKDLMTTATGAGIYNNAPGLGLLNRWDNFTVYAVTP